MALLSKSASSAWRVILAEFMLPTHLKACVNCLHTLMADDFVTQNGDGRVGREGYVASAFAILTNALKVRLGDAPDCEILTGDGKVLAYEISEAMEPGRARTREYADNKARLAAGGSRVERAEFISVEAACSSLREIAEKKVAKATKPGSAYQKTWGLLIYFNPGFVGDANESADSARLKVEARMADDVEIAKSYFSEVWVLWHERLYLLWKDGLRSSQILGPLVDENDDYAPEDDDLSDEDRELRERLFGPGD